MAVVESVALGASGLTVAPGDHVCAFYPSLADRDNILIPYLREGLNSDHKCFCIVDTSGPEAVLESLSAEIDLSSVPAAQLEVQHSYDVYLRDGGFCAEEMVDRWRQSLDEILARGAFDVVRAIGEMSWALREMPGVEELAEYESRINLIYPHYPLMGVCMYKLDRFSDAVLVDVFKTHPKILIGGMVLDNPYYLKPDEFLALRR